jgi:hypothetical protein
MSVLLKVVVPTAILTIVSATTAVAEDNEVLIGAATSFSGWMAAFVTSPTHAAAGLLTYRRRKPSGNAHVAGVCA